MHITHPKRSGFAPLGLFVLLKMSDREMLKTDDLSHIYTRLVSTHELAMILPRYIEKISADVDFNLNPHEDETNLFLAWSQLLPKRHADKRDI